MDFCLVCPLSDNSILRTESAVISLSSKTLQTLRTFLLGHQFALLDHAGDGSQYPERIPGQAGDLPHESHIGSLLMVSMKLILATPLPSSFTSTASTPSCRSSAVGSCLVSSLFSRFTTSILFRYPSDFLVYLLWPYPSLDSSALSSYRFRRHHHHSHSHHCRQQLCSAPHPCLH